MTIQKRRIVMKSFIESQFGYCPFWSGCFVGKVWTIGLIEYMKGLFEWSIMIIGVTSYIS